MTFAKKIYSTPWSLQSIQFFWDVTCLYFLKDCERGKSKFKILQMLFKVETLSFKMKNKISNITIFDRIMIIWNYAKVWCKFSVAIILLLSVLRKLQNSTDLSLVCSIYTRALSRELTIILYIIYQISSHGKKLRLLTE